jgi:hypothetical protein
MTSRRHALEGSCTDDFGDLLRWTLRDTRGEAQPPAYVWANIEREVRRRMAGGTGRGIQYGIFGTSIEFSGHVMSRQSILFSGWASYAPVTLVCIVEPQMSILKLASI